MLLLVGLGNPGPKYARTRHNVGFMVADLLAQEFGLDFRPAAKFQAEIAKGAGIILAKPQTSMNLSGQSVAQLARFHRVSPENITIIYDDLDLPLGTIRYRATGSSGGHNGMKSIIAALGSQDFPRLRIGIGRPAGRKAAADHVLAPFLPAERDELTRALEAAKVYIQTKLKQN